MRVEPLPEPWNAEDAAEIGSWGHPDRTYEPLLLVRCLQRQPALASRLRRLGEALYVEALLPPRLRTIAILRICGLLRCEYEWGGQAAFWGPLVGVSDIECDALAVGSPYAWGSAEQAVIDAVEEIERYGTLSESVWRTLDLTDEQRLELVIAVGWYRTICTLCNGMDLPVEGWMRPWPA